MGKTAIVVDSVCNKRRICHRFIYTERKDFYLMKRWDYASGSGVSTWRPISVLSTDIDTDGSIEVPVAAERNKNQSGADLRYKLNWCVFLEGKSTGLSRRYIP